MDRREYISDEWQQLILGFVDKEDKNRWELTDELYNPISGVDLSLQPFTDRAWVVTQSGMLYCYNALEYLVSGMDLVKDRTSGSHVIIELDQRYVLLGEDIEFIPWHARPLKEILKYRVWYQTPSGTKYGIQDGTPVAWGTDVWVTERQLQRSITDLVTITTTERGEYLLALDAIFTDGEEHHERVLVSVQSKQPVLTLDLSSLIPENIEGIDFDSDQYMWLKTTDKYYRINLHTDKMLIDYEQKLIYFKEPYEEVVVETDG